MATSDRPDDNAIAAFCAQAHVPCFRGSLDNVTDRMLAAARSAGAEVFVRINGDSPLIDPMLVDAVINLFDTEQPDLATNVYPRTFPKGFSVEVVRVESLERTRAMLKPGEEEHVTQAFYRCSDVFRISNVESGHDWGAVNMSVDTRDDLDLTERIILSAQDRLGSLGVEGLLAERKRCLETKS